MDRHTRSTFTRLRIAVVLAVVLCAAGCGGDSIVRVSSGGAPAGVSAGSSATVQVSTTSSSAAFAAFFLLHWAILNHRWDREAGLYGISTAAWAPPMDETRTVNMQDCTTPIADWSANLRCR
jgi:hypothetical protein